MVNTHLFQNEDAVAEIEIKQPRRQKTRHAFRPWACP
jgi:hypothetical protein